MACSVAVLAAAGVLVARPARAQPRPQPRPCWDRLHQAATATGADEVEVAVAGGEFELVLAHGWNQSGEACLLVLGDRGPLELASTVAPCDPRLPRCARVTARDLPRLPDAGVPAWIAVGAGEIHALRLRPAPSPCGRAPRPADEADRVMIRGDAYEPIDLRIAVDSRPDPGSPGCVWTDDANQPFHRLATDECVTGDWACQRVSLPPLGPGKHVVVARVGQATPVTFQLTMAADCETRPPPRLPETGESVPVVTAQGGRIRLGLALPDAVDKSCWWFAAPGPDGRTRQVWTEIQPCPVTAGATSAPAGPDDRTAGPPRSIDRFSCVEIVPADLPTGTYRAAVYIGGGDAQKLVLWVAPSRVALGLLIALGFGLSLLIGRVLQQNLELARLRRWHKHLEARLRSSTEDHELLLARIEAVLLFAEEQLARPFPRYMVQDLTLTREHLREADQLLELSGRKTELWDRLDSQLYPPPVRARVIQELRLFDHVVLQANFPLDDEAFAELTYEPLDRARALMDSAAPQFAADIEIAVAQALARVSAGDAEPKHTPASGSRVADQYRRHHDVVARAVADERNHLERLTGRRSPPPALVLEMALRVDVLHKLERLARALPGLSDADRQILDGVDTDALERCLTAWNTIDLQDGFHRAAQQRIYRDLLFELDWRPVNDRFAKQFHLLAASDVPRVQVQCAARWRTLAPEIVEVEPDAEFADLEDSYFWRQLIAVEWRAERVGADGARHDAGDAIHVVQRKLDPHHSGRSSGCGPRTVVFARREGTYVLTPTIALGQLGIPGTDAACQTIGNLKPVTIEAVKGEREAHQKRLSQHVTGRIVVSSLATLAVGSHLVQSWWADPPGTIVYLRAALLPLGIDLTTLAVPTVYHRVVRMLTKLRLFVP